jgi:hypothetical protein
VREVARFLSHHPAFEKVLLVAFRVPDADVLREALQRAAALS